MKVRYPRYKRARNSKGDGYARKRLIKRVGNVCEYCGREGYVECHHIVRWADGGTNSNQNVILLCKDGGCHYRADRLSEQMGRRMKAEGWSMPRAICEWYESFFNSAG